MALPRENLPPLRLDRVIGLERLWGATGLWICVGAGGGGALGLLGLFWRPVRTREKEAAA